jgi:protein-disulfide isomerase
MNPRCTVVILAMLAARLASAQAIQNKPAPPAPPKDVLAMIGDRPITDAQIEELAGERLARVKAEEYTIKRQVLDEYILQALMEKEAKARNISVEELRKREIDQKVMLVTEDAKRAVYESNPGSFQGKSETEALAQIEANLLRIRVQEARRRFMDSLKQANPVRIFYAAPRVAVDTKNEPSKGLDTAPVTLVAFSDYQCPYCSRIEPVFKQLEKKYGSRLRMVYRDFPLSQIHPNAIKSAEAAECAKDQGKFWEMHDKLFSNQQALSPTDLKKSAADLGLDTARFSECLDSGSKAAEWQRDLRDGQRYGVSGTPTVFINGRLIRGSSTLESISAVVDEELQSSGGSR